ncbi:hypothetical protein DRO61_12235 [Candidatus Bathyarchaeota archaeon]|nr:MAG: hypothetical protein DRO61_12235 [Candidatus Bathyarchaeota archaeon]
MSQLINEEDLVIHILNVGQGDSIIVEFPINKDGLRSYALVDAYKKDKTTRYLEKLQSNSACKTQLNFICATHPHWDHISAINSFLTNPVFRPDEFWDSGFRHQMKTYKTILSTLLTERIRMIRVTSGMEWYYGKVQITALAPSIGLRNRYATYGVDMNNASIVLRFEHHDEDILMKKSEEYAERDPQEVNRYDEGKSVVILAGDAEFDSWSYIVREFPRLEATISKFYRPIMTEVKKYMINYLNCSILKVAHHGSMHSTPLDACEIMSPRIAIMSTREEWKTSTKGKLELTRSMFPHESSVIALEESEAMVVTTDGSYEKRMINTNNAELFESYQGEGSVIVIIPPDGEAKIHKLDDELSEDPDPRPLYIPT